MSADAHYAAAAALIAACPKLSSQQLSNSEDSDDTCDGDEVQGANGSKPNKRKAPEIDWRAIEDPAERRRQRRLAKNRVTAARSRERKKLQWADMEVKIQVGTGSGEKKRQKHQHKLSSSTNCSPTQAPAKLQLCLKYGWLVLSFFSAAMPPGCTVPFLVGSLLLSNAVCYRLLSGLLLSMVRAWAAL